MHAAMTDFLKVLCARKNLCIPILFLVIIKQPFVIVEAGFLPASLGALYVAAPTASKH